MIQYRYLGHGRMRRRREDELPIIAHQLYLRRALFFTERRQRMT